MILVIDIGNTSVAFGLFKGRRLVRQWRVLNHGIPAFAGMTTFRKRFLQRRGVIKGVCVSSVVPRLDPVIKKAIKKHFGCPILFVTSKNAGIKINHYNKKQIGADRLVNAVAAYEKYHKPVIIIDFGTATTFDYVTPRGEYGGGVIAPGIAMINSALSKMTAKLPKVTIKKTGRIIAQNTKDGMQAGVFHGYVGLVDHIIEKMKKEIGGHPKIIATGGFASIIAKSVKTIEEVDPFLTLKGLKIIWERANK